MIIVYIKLHFLSLFLQQILFFIFSRSIKTKTILVATLYLASHH